MRFIHLGQAVSATRQMRTPAAHLLIQLTPLMSEEVFATLFRDDGATHLSPTALNIAGSIVIF